MSSGFIDRRVEPAIARGLATFRVLILNGPRQSGKSTLMGRAHERTGGSLVTLDDRSSLRLARTDPGGLVAEYARPTYIDEVQRGGDGLVLTIKAEVDRRPLPGSFVLAGSSRFLTVPTLSESLAGRAQIVDVWPLSLSEIQGSTGTFVDMLMGPTSDLRQIEAPPTRRSEVAQMIVTGGFPEVVNLAEEQRADWFDAYRRTMLTRDLTELRRIRHATDVPRLLALAAARTAQEINLASYAEALGLTPGLVRDYLAMLETVYLQMSLPAWASSATTRAKRKSKLHFVDTGLMCSVRNVGADRLADPLYAAFGSILETFVAMDLVKQQTWSAARPTIHHFRDREGREVDIVLEDRDGRISGVEVKAAVDIDERDLRGLRHLRDSLGDRFVNGVVLHLGDRPVALGDRLTALPVSALWHG